MSTYKLTSMSLNEKDIEVREECENIGYGVIDTWRYGASKLLAKKGKKSTSKS